MIEDEDIKKFQESVERFEGIFDRRKSSKNNEVIDEMSFVCNWKEARHWYSVHFSLYGALFNGIFAAIVKGSSIAVAMVGVLPLRYVFISGAVLSIMAGLGRVVHQKVPNPPIKTIPRAP